MKCSHCEAPMNVNRDKVASFCTMGQGDEYTDRYWVCRKCGWFLRRSFRESFASQEETEYGSTALEPEKGQAIIDLIKKCPKPTDKWCDCEVHKHFE